MPGTERVRARADARLLQVELLFWDEVDWGAAASLEPTACLTDHNAMSSKASAHFSPAAVRAVLDHHNDEGLYSHAELRSLPSPLLPCPPSPTHTQTHVCMLFISTVDQPIERVTIQALDCC